MDPFAVPEFLGGDPVPDVPEIDDLDFDIQFDGSDIMDLDCDPDFNNFLRELANEDPCPCCAGATVCEATSSYGKTSLNMVSASGAEDSTSPPRSPSGSSGNESCQYGPCSDAKYVLPVDSGMDKISMGRRAKAESEDMRYLRVKERNRLYAARTRQRKNRLVQDLRQRCSHLEAENSHLQSRVVQLQEEVDGLRDKRSTGGGTRANSPGGTSEKSSPSSNTHCPVSAPVILSVKPAVVRTVPNQKAKNKLRFTAAAAAACPQEDAAVHTVSPPVSTTSHGSDTRGIVSSDLPGDKGAIQSYKGTVTHAAPVKPEPRDNVVALKRPIERTSTGTARRVRGRGASGSRSQAPLSMATIGVLALAAVSCLGLVAFPALSLLSPGVAPVEPSGLMAAPRHTRALLADSESSISTAQRLAIAAHAGEDRLVPYENLPPDVVHDEEYYMKEEYDDWVGVDDDARHVLLSAAFVCNHTTCVAVPKSGASWTRVVPEVPVELRQEDPRARNALQATVFSALGNAGPHPPASVAAGEHLRGDMHADNSATQSRCTDGSCEESQQSTGEALSMAGLLAPQACKLVLRSHGAARKHAVGSEIAQSVSAPAHAKAVVETGEEVMEGGVALLRSVQQSAEVQPAAQRQQVVIGEGLNESEKQDVVSVLFPAWKSDVEEEGVLTPMQHMYVLVVEGDDLLTYECNLSRALYI